MGGTRRQSSWVSALAWRSGVAVLKANNDNVWAGVVTVIPPQTTVQEAKDETPTWHRRPRTT